MIKTTIKVLAFATMVYAVASCNSETETINSQASSSAMISAFSLEADEGILPNLDSVYFSIDQNTGRIYNADSLPYGTPVTGIVPLITSSSVSALKLHIPRGEGQTDTIVDYLENMSDSVDFTYGAVKAVLTALDGKSTRTYTLCVNVHKVKTDTLVWDRSQQGNLPSRFMVPNSQRTAATASAIYCLTSFDGEYCIARADNPGATWSNNLVTFPFVPRVETFNATDDALYILDADNKLYTSVDGMTWTYTDQTWNNIYGNYGTELWGSKQVGGEWKRVSYPTNKSEVITPDFPISQASQMVNYKFEMAVNSQALLTGGILASGVVSDRTWGYDGKTWVCLTQKNPLPHALKSPVVVPYFVTRVDSTTWTVTSQSVLLAMFGEREDGALNDSVYVSTDFGINWKKADDQMQLSKSFPGRLGAQGFVYTQTLMARSAVGYMIDWRTLGNPRLPFGATLVNAPMSRATAPITQWECPYIYVFGGYNQEGITYNTLWRAVIQRFTFKPLQ